MFPRGYFKRVGTVIGWALVTILAIIGLIQILMHAETRGDAAKDDELVPRKYAASRLWKCTCSDEGNTTIPEMHARDCEYRNWYEDEKRKAIKKRGSE